MSSGQFHFNSVAFYFSLSVSSSSSPLHTAGINTDWETLSNDIIPAPPAPPQAASAHCGLSCSLLSRCWSKGAVSQSMVTHSLTHSLSASRLQTHLTCHWLLNGKHWWESAVWFYQQTFLSSSSSSCFLMAEEVHSSRMFLPDGATCCGRMKLQLSVCSSNSSTSSSATSSSRVRPPSQDQPGRYVMWSWELITDYYHVVSPCVCCWRYNIITLLTVSRERQCL